MTYKVQKSEVKSHKKMEEAIEKEQEECWSLGNREDQSFEKGPLTWWKANSRWGGIWLILLTFKFRRTTQRNKTRKWAESIKETQTLIRTWPSGENCLGVIWKLLVPLVKLGRTLPCISTWIDQHPPHRTHRDNKECLEAFWCWLYPSLLSTSNYWSTS